MDFTTHKYRVIRTQCYVWCACLCLLPFCDNAGLSMRSDKMGNTTSTYVEYGQNVTINCTVYAETITSDDIEFTLSGKHVGSVKINETTRTLFIPKPKIGYYAYCCKSIINRKSEYVQNTLIPVYVGLKPANVTDFKCSSYNLDILECCWSPHSEVVKTEYVLNYSINNGSRSNNCNIENISKHKCCNLSGSSNPLYRYDTPKFYFHLKSSNELGYTEQKFPVDYSIVKLKEPRNLTAVSIGCHRVELQWNIVVFTEVLPNVMHKIYYQMPDVNETIYYVNASSLRVQSNSTIIKFNITSLPYANTKYRMSVKMKLKEAISDDYWSEAEVIDITTESERPQKPPELPAGAFRQSIFQNGRIIKIFWKQLKAYEQAGKSFKYTVHFEPKNVRPEKINSEYLELNITSFDAVSVSVWSENERGMSVDNSNLYIPAYRNTHLKVENFTIFSKENSTYELFWKTAQEVDNYTLFWCLENDFLTCKDIEYEIINKSSTNYTIYFDKSGNYQFALSANFNLQSSGMILPKPTCVLSEKSLSLWRFSIAINAKEEKNSVTLTWFMDCIYKEGIITGYNITYCPVDETEHCNSNSIYKNIRDAKATTYTINNLLPFTRYTIEINANMGFGVKATENNIKYVRTLQDTPSKPKCISILDIKNDSLVISLQSPVHLNGNINNTKYIIQLNDELRREKIKNGTSNITIDGLRSFTNYNITVRAYNENITRYSEATDPIYVTTRTFSPSMLVVQYNQSLSMFDWDPPTLPGGPVIEYQIKFIFDGKDEEIHNTTELYFEKSNSELCDVASENVTYQVRAVSRDNYTRHGFWVPSGDVCAFESLSGDNQPTTNAKHFGDWSKAKSVICKTRNSLLSVYIIFGAAFVAILVSAGIKIYKIIVECTNVGGVIFPPGLEPKGEPTAPTRNEIEKEDLKKNNADKLLSSQNEKPRHGEELRDENAPLLTTDQLANGINVLTDPKCFVIISPPSPSKEPVPNFVKGLPSDTVAVPRSSDYIAHELLFEKISSANLGKSQHVQIPALDSQNGFDSLNRHATAYILHEQMNNPIPNVINREIIHLEDPYTRFSMQ